MFEGYWGSVAIFFGINVLMAFSLYVPMTAGLISLGQGGFMAIGAYASAVLTKDGVPFSIAVGVGGLLAALSGIVVGIPAIRIRGIYLIILTLGFGEIVRVFFLNFSYTGGANGIGGMAPYTNFAWVASACLVTGLVAWRLRYARIGRAMIAIHADEVAAQAMGVNVVRAKLAAFAGRSIHSGRRRRVLRALHAVHRFRPIRLFAFRRCVSVHCPWRNCQSAGPDSRRSGGDADPGNISLPAGLADDVLWRSPDRRCALAAGRLGSRHQDTSMTAILRVDDVSKRFGGFLALSNVSCEVAEGRIHAPDRPQRGRQEHAVEYHQRSHRANKRGCRVRRASLYRPPPDTIHAMGIARNFQHVRLFKGLSVLENVMIGSDAQTGTGTWSDVVDLALPFRDRDAVTRQAQEALQFVGMEAPRQPRRRSTDFG